MVAEQELEDYETSGDLHLAQGTLDMITASEGEQDKTPAERAIATLKAAVPANLTVLALDDRTVLIEGIVPLGGKRRSRSGDDSLLRPGDAAELPPQIAQRGLRVGGVAHALQPQQPVGHRRSGCAELCLHPLGHGPGRQGVGHH